MAFPRLPPFGLAVASALLFGVLVVQGLPVLPPYVVSILLLGAAIFLFRYHDQRRLFAAVLIGFSLAALHGRFGMAQQWPQRLSGSDVLVHGQVLGLPIKDKYSTRFELRVLTAEGQGGEQISQQVSELVGQKLRVSWYELKEKIQPGSEWKLLLRLRPPRGVLNPGGLDSERRALVQGISANAYVRDPENAKNLRDGHGIDFLRDHLSKKIAAALLGERARFVQALALGDVRGLTDSDWQVLRACGLTHLIAISGFHVGIVAGFAALLAGALYWCFPRLGRVWPRPLAMATAAVLAALAYTALAGFALPTVRTLVMIAAIALARLLRRPQRLRDGFALALIAILLIDPLSVLMPGFWLSFLGVGWLLWCLPHNRKDGVLRPFLSAQAVALIGLLPLTVWFFNSASLSGPLVNLIGIPWISFFVVPLALLGLLVSSISNTAAAFLWQLAAWLMDCLWQLLTAISRSDFGLTWLPEPSFAALMLALIGAFILLLPRGVPGKALALLLFLPMFWPPLKRPPIGSADIHTLDVGQGLSVVVSTAEHTLLFDTGAASSRGLDYGEAVVVPALHALGVHRLDQIIISHGDNDHAGGLDAVLRAYPGAPVAAPEGWAKPNIALCQRDQTWSWDGVSFRVVHPPPIYPYQRNDSSCVLRIETGDHAALLPGDISRQVEIRLLKEQKTALKADLLIAPHHGSPTSSSEAFITAVAPQLTVFAVGSDNRFRLPKTEIVARYRRAGGALLDSAGSGTISVRLGPEGLSEVSARREGERRYWRHVETQVSGYASDSADEAGQGR